MRDSEELIPVGKIIDTHGIKGQVKLHSYSGNAESLAEAHFITLKSPSGKLSEYALKGFKPNAGRFIITLKDFDDINQVIPLVGSEVCLKRSQLPPLEADEYYWNDLIGLRVETVDGIQIGTIADIFETGSNDVYVVKGNDREYLIPAIADVVTAIDLQAGKVTITLLDGLLDL